MNFNMNLKTMDLLYFLMGAMVLMSPVPGGFGFIGVTNGDLWLLGDDPNSAKAGTTVRGICNVTSRSLTSNVNFYASNLFVTNSKGIRLAQDTIVPISRTAIQFKIHNIAKSQYGKYKCYHQNKVSGKKDLIYDRWFFVGVKPMIPRIKDVLVYNWENMTIVLEPSMTEQNQSTHDERDTAIELATKCLVSYNWSIGVLGGDCSVNMQWIKCPRMDTASTKCVVPSGLYRNLSGRRPPNYICIKAECWNKAFGNSSKVYKVDLAQKVKPAPVPSITARVQYNTTVNLSWKQHIKWRMYDDRVTYNVNLTANNLNHQVNYSDVEATSLAVTNLIPHGRYDVSITAKPKYAGLESEPTVTHVTMPSAVPGENPQVIAVDVSPRPGGESTRITLFWKKIPPEKTNGEIMIKVTVYYPLGRQKREVEKVITIPGDQTSYSRVEPTNPNYEFKLETVSKSLGRNPRLIPSTIQVQTDSEESSPFQSVQAERDSDETHINITWTVSDGMAKDTNVSIIYCEKDPEENECDEMFPLNTLIVPASYGFVRVNKSSGIYKMGLVWPKPGRPGYIQWSPCIYMQGEVPDLAPHINLFPELKAVEVKVQQYRCEETRALVQRVEGSLCSTSDRENCDGAKLPINISGTEFAKLHAYPVDPGSHYMASVQAVSTNGRSPVGKKVIFIAGDGGDGALVGTVVGVLVTVLIIIVVGVFGYRKYQEVKSRGIRMTRTLAVAGELGGHEDYEEPFDDVRLENSYESLQSLIDGEAGGHVEPEEIPPASQIPVRRIDQDTSTSGTSVSVSGAHTRRVSEEFSPAPPLPSRNSKPDASTSDARVGPSAGGFTDEDEDGTGGQSALSMSGGLGYQEGIIPLIEARHIPMSVFQNSGGSADSAEVDIPQPEEHDEIPNCHLPEAQSPKPQLPVLIAVPNEAETGFNSRDSFDACTSRGTNESGSSGAQDYSKVAQAVEPNTSVLPTLHDELAIRVEPTPKEAIRVEPKQKEANADSEEQKYRECGPRGALS